ncbi:MAG: cupin domain-containing protein, partial [Acidobacteriota bacterium]
HWLGGLPSPLPRPEIWEQIERRLDDDPRRAVDALDLPLPPNARGELATSGFFVTDQPWIDLPAGSSRAIRVGSDPAQDLELFVVATPGGERFPRHRHSGAEVVAVLVGAYVENDIGRTAAGDYRRYAPGSIHSPTIVGTDVCMALTLNQGGVEFLAA